MQVAKKLGGSEPYQRIHTWLHQMSDQSLFWGSVFFLSRFTHRSINSLHFGYHGFRLAMSRQISAVPDSCCIMNQRLVESVGGVVMLRV